MLRLKTAFYNRMAINIITDIFIAVYTVLSCGVWDEAQHATPLQSFSKTQRIIIISVKSVKSVPYKLSIVNFPLMKSVPNEFSILNFQFSI